MGSGKAFRYIAQRRPTFETAAVHNTGAIVMDNVIYVDFSRKDQVNELVSRKLDEEKITDADLRRAVLARAETWCSWLTPRIDIKAENIALTLTDLPEDVREAARPEIQQWMVEHLSAWFKEAGMEAISEVIGLAIGQAALRQRAREYGIISL